MVLVLVNCVLDDNFIVRSKKPAPIIPSISLSELLFEQIDKHGNKELFIDHPSGRRWTASQIKETAIKIAAGLVESGLKEGEVVCGYCPNNDLHAVSQFGIYASGAVYAGCYWTNTLRELNHYVEVAEAAYIFCSKTNLAIASSVADTHDFVRVLVVIDSEVTKITQTKNGRKVYPLSAFTSVALDSIKHKIPVPLSKSSKECPVGILFSSGSTGNPKGVIKTHFNQVAACTEARVQTSIFGPVDGRVTCHQPLPHLSGFMTVMMSINMGLTIVFNPEFEVQTFLETVEKYKITSAYLAPNYIILLLKSPLLNKYDISSLKLVSTGGACLHETAKAETVNKLQLDNLRQLYGSTEAGGVTMCPTDVHNPNTVGIPSPGKEIKIVDPLTGKALGPNQVGEAYIRSPEVSPGYIKNPTATAENFTSDGFVKSGDAMYYDNEGFFFIVDRYKEMIKVDTQQVAPVELESILLQHNAVKEAAIVGIPSEKHGQVPKAYVALKDGFGGEVLRQELIAYLNHEVGEWKQLRGGMDFVETLPKISLGKVDRVALKKLCGFSNF